MNVTNLTEEEQLEIGLSLANFMNTPAGDWLVARLKEKANQIGQEALINDDAKTPMAFYKGRLYEVRETLHDLEAMAGHAVGVVRERVQEEEDKKARKEGKKLPSEDRDDDENMMLPRSGSGTISAPTSFGQE